MTTRGVTRGTVMGLLLLTTGCSNKTGGDPTGGSVPPSSTPAPGSETPQRAEMTAADCEAKEGRVVGGIGDGAIHRPDYKCESGKAPIGTIKPAEGEPIAIEGSVCCPG